MEYITQKPLKAAQSLLFTATLNSQIPTLKNLLSNKEVDP